MVYREMPDQMVPLGSVDVPERKDPPGKWDPPDPRAYLAFRDPQESQVPQDQVAKGDYVYVFYRIPSASKTRNKLVLFVLERSVDSNMLVASCYVA